MKVHVVPVLSDNYAYVVVDDAGAAQGTPAPEIPPVWTPCPR